MQSAVGLLEDFRRKGRRVTPQRELIIRLLDGDTTHPSAETIFERARQAMPAISLKTVYQVLNELAVLGHINLVEVGTGSGRFDPNTSDHHHLVCSSCGAIFDIALADDNPVPELVGQGFIVDGVEVIFRGRCASCHCPE